MTGTADDASAQVAPTLDGDKVLSGWSPARAPYRRLRPALLEAEAQLNDAPAGAWQRLRLAAGDDPVAAAAAAAVNDPLAELLLGWRLIATDDGSWRVALVPASGVRAEELAAAQALTLLVEGGGWARLGRCARPACSRVLLDWTSDGNRRACRAHERK